MILQTLKLNQKDDSKPSQIGDESSFDITEVAMKGTIEELCHGKIIPHEDSRTNSKEMKELLGYIAKASR
jgi:hypothetical protein